MSLVTCDFVFLLAGARLGYCVLINLHSLYGQMQKQRYSRRKQENSYHLPNTFHIPGSVLRNVRALFYLMLILGVGTTIISALQMRRPRLAER